MCTSQKSVDIQGGALEFGNCGEPGQDSHGRMGSRFSFYPTSVHYFRLSHSFADPETLSERLCWMKGWAGPAFEEFISTTCLFCTVHLHLPSPCIQLNCHQLQAYSNHIDLTFDRHQGEKHSFRETFLQHFNTTILHTLLRYYQTSITPFITLHMVISISLESCLGTSIIYTSKFV